METWRRFNRLLSALKDDYQRGMATSSLTKPTRLVSLAQKAGDLSVNWGSKNEYSRECTHLARPWAALGVSLYHKFEFLTLTCPAIVLSSHTTRAYLINYARPLIYTTAMALPSLASIKVTYDFLMNNGGEPLMRNLHGLMNHTHSLLQSICTRYKPPTDLLRLDPNPPKSPIIPLFTAHPRSLAQHCQRGGFMVRPIVAPTVPEGSERVRICLHAGNTAKEVEALLEAVEEWLRSRMQDAGKIVRDGADCRGRLTESSTKVQTDGEKAKL